MGSGSQKVAAYEDTNGRAGRGLWQNALWTSTGRGTCHSSSIDWTARIYDSHSMPLCNQLVAGPCAVILSHAFVHCAQCFLRQATQPLHAHDDAAHVRQQLAKNCQLESEHAGHKLLFHCHWQLYKGAGWFIAASFHQQCWHGAFCASDPWLIW